MKRLLLVVVLVWVLVVACAPAPTPDVPATVEAAVAATLAAYAPRASSTVTLEPATDPAPAPTAVAATEPPPTSPPSPSPPTPSPIPAILARVVSRDGEVFDIADAQPELTRHWSTKLGGYNQPFEVARFEVSIKNLVNVYIPADQVERIDRAGGEEGTFTIKLAGGESLEGTMGRNDAATFLDCTLRGETVVEGYPAQLDLPFSSIVSIEMSQAEGRVVGRVTTDDGKQTEVSDPRCLMEALPDWSGTSPKGTLMILVGGSTLEIPVADIAQIELGAEGMTLRLRDGKEITGQAAGTYYLSGTMTMGGQPAFLYAPFSSLASISFE